MKAPIAKKVPHILKAHNHVRIDNYFWLNDRENQEVVDYLNAENKYTKTVLKETEPLQKELYKEMKARIKEDDASAPYFSNGYWYYTRYEIGQEHPISCRKKESLENKEEILFDENIEAKNHPYYDLVAFSITEDNNTMAFAEDITGRRQYRIRFKNLITDEIFPNIIENAGGDLAWLNNGKEIYYNIKDENTLRPHQIMLHNLDDNSNISIYEEEDDTYICSVSKTKDSKHIFIGSYATLSTEFRFKSADDTSNFNLFIAREKDHEYYPESAQDGFYIKSNLNAANFKMVHCTLNERNPKNWKTVQKHDPTILVEDFEVFNQSLVVQEKENGLSRLRIYETDGLKSKVIPPFEEAYTLYIGTNPEAEQDTVRIGYSSLTTPHSVYDIDLKTFEKKLIKQTQVLGEFKPENYHSERIWANAEDGAKIPVSLVYRKDKFSKDGTNPLLIYAYGSYGSTIDAYFSSVRLSLLDRGFVYAIAHIRGGEYLGRAWYDQGKLLAKMNTFTDFISCAEHLVKQKYTHSEKVFGMGGSAGGLLMGAIANLKPELWRGLVSHVPFVDVISTMMDETIPLTTGEYDEWGNPNEEVFYKYMLSYSPYDQIESKDYPAMLITSGLHDSQVQFWEPTKYVAKLRELKTDNNPILLYTNMEAGHGGASGRFEQLKEIALDYAFIINLCK